MGQLLTKEKKEELISKLWEKLMSLQSIVVNTDRQIECQNTKVENKFVSEMWSKVLNVGRLCASVVMKFPKFEVGTKVSSEVWLKFVNMQRIGKSLRRPIQFPKQKVENKGSKDAIVVKKDSGGGSEF